MVREDHYANHGGINGVLEQRVDAWEISKMLKVGLVGRLELG